MTTVAIELNDAEIRVADPSGVLAIEPGYAWLDGEEVIVGEDAFRAASLQPRQVHSRYWSGLDRTEIRRERGRPITRADLAWEQLRQLWERCGSGADDAVFVVPGWMQRDQLALLLGIADAAHVPVRGLVDVAVASCERAFPGARLLHLDVGLHLAAVTALEQDGAIERRDVEVIPGLGLAALRAAQVSAIARAFVEQARFDPLHDAGGEQALHDRLPDLVGALRARASARLQLDHGGVTRSAEIQRRDLTRPAAELCRALRDRVESAGEGPRVALVSHRVAELPGFSELMREVPRLEVVRLQPEAPCRGALARLDQIPLGGPGHRRVRRVSLPASVPAAEPALEAATPDPHGA